MASDRDTTRMVRAWLEQGVTDLPDRLLDSVLDQLPTTQQRRSWGPALRLPQMNSTFKLLMAAAAVVVAAVISFNLLRDDSMPGVGAPAAVDLGLRASPTTSGSPGTDPAVDSNPVGSGPMTPGRYHIDRVLDHWATSGGSRTRGGMARVTFDVPDGWSGFEGFAITKSSAGSSGELAIAPMAVESVYPDPCRWLTGSKAHGPADWDRGRTMQGLADGLWTSWATDNTPGYSPRDGAALTAPKATLPVDVTLGGFQARYLEVRAPADVDLAACDGGQYTLFIDALGGQRYIHRAGELNRLWVLDVAGSGETLPGGLLVLDAASHPDSSPQDLAELQAIIDSIRIELLSGS
jgi:hypothetical protein